MDNATTSEQHTGRQRSDSAEPDSDGFPRRTSLRETDLSHPAKGGFHPCFCLPACCNCPVALSEFTTLTLMIQLCLNLKVLKHAIAAGKTDCKIEFASQMWAARPHLGSIFEKLLHRKTFSFACGSHFIMHYKNLAALLPFGHTVHSPDAQHAP